MSLEVAGLLKNELFYWNAAEKPVISIVSAAYESAAI